MILDAIRILKLLGYWMLLLDAIRILHVSYQETDAIMILDAIRILEAIRILHVSY